MGRSFQVGRVVKFRVQRGSRCGDMMIKVQDAEQGARSPVVHTWWFTFRIWESPQQDSPEGFKQRDGKL